MLGDRGALLEKEVDLERDYNVTHEDEFLSSWLRDGAEGQAEEVNEMRKRTKKEHTKEWGKTV